jgi:hypothetical protein
MTIVFQYLTFLWTLSTLWNVSWILTTSCTLIFTKLGVPVEVLAFTTLRPILTVSYVVITVIRIGLVLTRRRRRGRRSRSTSANYAGASFHVKVLTLCTALSCYLTAYACGV